MMDDFRYHFKRVLPFIVTILLILVLPAYIFLKKNGFVFFEKKVRKEALLLARQDSIHVADSLKKIKIESKGVKKIQQTPLGKSDKEEHPVSAGDIRGTYYIITGSFTNTENAKLAAGKYRNLGYKTSIISMPDRNGIKTEYVSVKTFSNIKEAEEYLKKFKEKSDTAAWIYSKK